MKKLYLAIFLVAISVAVYVLPVLADGGGG